MSGSVKDYRKMIEQPGGRMFYDLLYRQLIIPDDKKARILDFGAGFCLTAGHYAERHEVIALEPDEEMRSLRVEGAYILIPQGLEYLRTIEDSSVDVVICHNVLEYTNDREEILTQLVRVLREDGILSVIKHNLPGRVLGSAVLGDNPGAALDLLDHVAEDSMFGSRDVYSNEYLMECISDRAALEAVYGIRTFFGLSSNNEIKFTDEWYRSMLELETRVSNIDEFRRIAFFNHLIFRKR